MNTFLTTVWLSLGGVVALVQDPIESFREPRAGSELKPGPNYRRHDSGPTYPMDDFSWRVTKTYVQDAKEFSTADGVNVVYGKLAGNLGYIYFSDLVPATSGRLTVKVTKASALHRR